MKLKELIKKSKPITKKEWQKSRLNAYKPVK
jgi:hypothetical protein